VDAGSERECWEFAKDEWKGYEPIKNKIAVNKTKEKTRIKTNDPRMDKQI